jgi:hypothetical protein
LCLRWVTNDALATSQKHYLDNARVSLSPHRSRAHHKLSLSFCCRVSRFFLIVKLNHANETVVGFYIKSDIMNRKKIDCDGFFFEFSESVITVDA